MGEFSSFKLLAHTQAARCAIYVSSSLIWTPYLDPSSSKGLALCKDVHLMIEDQRVGT